ncbi:hypothetical protein HK105_205777 [Polyrhizophydium stewartii]|uniref:UBA domain-containing protein n=1 Tax=Polyrhizophydium stewartii TaxID=2732419 RepID=A0ABR4N590_9FUNG
MAPERMALDELEHARQQAELEDTARQARERQRVLKAQEDRARRQLEATRRAPGLQPGAGSLLAGAAAGAAQTAANPMSRSDYLQFEQGLPPPDPWDSATGDSDRDFEMLKQIMGVPGAESRLAAAPQRRPADGSPPSYSVIPEHLQQQMTGQQQQPPPALPAAITSPHDLQLQQMHLLLQEQLRQRQGQGQAQAQAQISAPSSQALSSSSLPAAAPEDAADDHSRPSVSALVSKFQKSNTIMSAMPGGPMGQPSTPPPVPAPPSFAAQQHPQISQHQQQQPQPPFVPSRPAPPRPPASQSLSPQSVVHDRYFDSPVKDAIFINVAQMGFRTDLIERAILLHQTDERLILEFLVQASEWASAGYSVNAIEMTLSAKEHNKGISELDFLSAYVRLEELGFRPQLIRDALLSKGLDVDRAIEYLTGGS